MVSERSCILQECVSLPKPYIGLEIEPLHLDVNEENIENISSLHSPITDEEFFEFMDYLQQVMQEDVALHEAHENTIEFENHSAQ